MWALVCLVCNKNHKNNKWLSFSFTIEDNTNILEFREIHHVWMTVVKTEWQVDSQEGLE